MFRAFTRGKYQPLIVLFLMLFLSLVTFYVPKTAFLLGAGIFLYGFYRTLVSRNRFGEAHLYASFLMGAEVYFRMSFAGLPWEFSKITVFILLLTGMIVERQKKPFLFLFLLYLLLLLPGVMVPEWSGMEMFKKEFMFSFFGQVVLVVSALYFYKRPFDMSDLIRIGRWMLTGVVLTSFMLYLKTPDYSTIHYGGGSNFAASGGFGPNQVTAILGLGIILSGAFLLLNKKIFTYRLVDISLLSLFILQGLFTLSRGGLMAAVLSLFLAIFIVYLTSPKATVKLLHLSIIKIVFLIGLIGFATYLSNNISGGAVLKRYLNVDKYGQTIKEDYSTKRIDIVKDDLYTFTQYPITGAGIGGGRAYREQNTGISAAHVELSRMVAEHGILGMLALIILIFFPIYLFFRTKSLETRFFLVLFVAYGILTMTHNAMRLAMPSFLYGLGFISLYQRKDQ